MSKRHAPDGAQSVLRAVALLKTIAASERDKDLGELTRGSGLTRTTTRRLLSALESEGLVKRDQSGAYRLGPTAIAIGTRALRRNDLRSTVRPHLAELAETSRETATLEIFSDGEMLILDEVAGTHLLAVTASLGTVWALHATASGKALLAALPEEEAAALLPARLKRFTANTVADKLALVGEFEKIRAQGYATAIDELEVGFVATAAVIRDALGTVVGAISINAPATRLTGQKLRRAIGQTMRCAARASHALGWRA